MSLARASHDEWESDILEQLDNYAKEYDFPMLNNAYFLNADVRLTAFRGSSEWLLVFQEILLSEQHGFVNSVSTYGNRVSNPGTQQAIPALSAPPNHSIWDGDRQFLLDQFDFEVVVGDNIRHFTPSREDYRRAGVDVDSDMPVPAQVLRLVAHLAPDDLFTADEKLLELCGRIDADVEKFMQLEDWHHPDIADDELPSGSECFQTLALAIARDDKSLYSCPENNVNTHWSNWQLEDV